MRERAEEFIELADWAATHVEPVKITKLRSAPKKKRAELVEEALRSIAYHSNLRDPRLAQEDLLTVIERLPALDKETVPYVIGQLSRHPYLDDEILEALRSSPVLQKVEHSIRNKTPEGEVLDTTANVSAAANVHVHIARAHLAPTGWEPLVSDQLQDAPAHVDAIDKSVVFNFEHFSTAPIEEVLSTIKHYTAHALVGQEHGHNAHWEFEARLLGLTDLTPCADSTAAPAPEDATVLRAVEVFDAMETEVIDTLKFQFAKKHKEYFDRTGMTLSDLFKLAQAGDL